MPVSDITGQVYLGTILLEKNRWPDSPATRFTLGERLCRGRAALPTVRVSEWAERARTDGFDGLELWENHALLADDEELERLAGMPLPVAIYSSYFGLDEEDAVWREVAAEAVVGLGAAGVKYNFGPDPARRDVYLRHLREWAALLPAEVRLVCECHKGNIAGNDPAQAAALLVELGEERYQATVHFGYEWDEFRAWVERLGPRLGHIHAGANAAQGRTFVAERVLLLRDHGFRGSFTVEFTEGIAWGPPDPPLETLYASAVADLNMLREVLN